MRKISTLLEGCCAMNKFIVLKYDELWLKSKEVRSRMQQKLLEHLKEVLKAQIRSRREFVEIRGCENPEILKAIPGISLIETRISYEFKDLEDLWNKIDEWLQNKEFESFGVRIKRKYKGHDFKSRDVEVFLGEKIVTKYGKKVNLTHPDLWIRVDIYKDEFHVIEGIIRGLGGLPYASEGSCLISQPSYLLIKEVLKRGMYIKNIPEDLRFLYPYRNISQDFEVIFSAECFDKLSDLKKSKKQIILYPFVHLSKEEFDKLEKEATLFFKELRK